MADFDNEVAEAQNLTAQKRQRFDDEVQEAMRQGQKAGPFQMPAKKKPTATKPKTRLQDVAY